MTAYIVAGEDTGEAYEWDITDVWYEEETGSFYLYAAGGCSCNYAYDEYGYDETPPMADLDGPYSLHQVLGKVSVNLIEKVLRWDKAGRQPVTKSVDRW